MQYVCVCVVYCLWPKTLFVNSESLTGNHLSNAMGQKNLLCVLYHIIVCRVHYLRSFITVVCIGVHHHTALPNFYLGTELILVDQPRPSLTLTFLEGERWSGLIDLSSCTLHTSLWVGFSLEIYFQMVHSTIGKYETPLAMKWEARVVTAIGRV